jgi:MFS family permease
LASTREIPWELRPYGHGSGTPRAQTWPRFRVYAERCRRTKTRLPRQRTGLAYLDEYICHCLVGVASLILPEDSPVRPYVILVLITAFVLSMQTFLNIAVWVWLAEIFPLQIRGLAIGIAVFFGWFINGLLALYVPTLLAALGMGTFFLFAVIGVIMLGFLWHEVPETRNRSLESLEEELLDGSIYQSLPRRLPFAGLLYDRRR